MNGPLSTLHPHYRLEKRGGDELEYADGHVALFEACLKTARFGDSGRNMPELQSTLMGWADWIMEARIINGEFEYDWRRNRDSGSSRVLAA
jgi:hypothetical protein